MAKQFYVYIISNTGNTVLYIGVASDLIKRIYQHKNKMISGFSSRYNLTKLIYFEVLDDPINAIKREKQLKNLVRRKKDKMINKSNPGWRGLYSSLL